MKAAWTLDGDRFVVKFDGIGGGRHAMRGLSAPAEARALYFRIVVQFAGDQVTHSSPEMSITVLPARS